MLEAVQLLANGDALMTATAGEVWPAQRPPSPTSLRLSSEWLLMHAAQRYSLGDWAAAVLLFCVGLYLDKARPFEQYIGNRLADPSI